MRMLSAIAKETIAPIVTTRGRSPSSSGSSSSRTRSLRISERLTPARSASAATSVPSEEALAVSPPWAPRSPRGSAVRADRRALLALAAVGALALAAAHRWPRTAGVERAGSSPATRLGIGGVADRADDDGRAGAGRGDLGEVPGSMPPIANQGSAGVAGGVGDVLEAGGRTAGLRRRRPDGADAEVVGASRTLGGEGRVELLGRVAREADDRSGPARRAPRRPGVSSWPTWTPSAAGGDEVGAVVDEEEGAVAIGGGAEDGRGLEQPALGGVLVAELDQVGAAAEGSSRSRSSASGSGRPRRRSRAGRGRAFPGRKPRAYGPLGHGR